jgi:hypothetical protein
MPTSLKFLAGSILLLGFCRLVVAAGGDSTQSMPFEAATVRFEHNATDGDVEVVFDITGSDEGLEKLTVVSPDGRTVVEFAAPDASTLGIRSFQLESPEPTDVKSLKAAYPDGTYTFTATTVSGRGLHGESTLSHRLPATVSIVRPGAGAVGVGTGDLRISWTPVDSAAFYIVEIEQDELGTKLKAELPASEPAFVVPPGFLRSGKEYQLTVGTVTDEGNISFVETTFNTTQ